MLLNAMLSNGIMQCHPCELDVIQCQNAFYLWFDEDKIRLSAPHQFENELMSNTQSKFGLLFASFCFIGQIYVAHLNYEPQNFRCISSQMPSCQCILTVRKRPFYRKNPIADRMRQITITGHSGFDWTHPNSSFI